MKRLHDSQYPHGHVRVNKRGISGHFLGVKFCPGTFTGTHLLIWPYRMQTDGRVEQVVMEHFNYFTTCRLYITVDTRLLYSQGDVYAKWTPQPVFSDILLHKVVIIIVGCLVWSTYVYVNAYTTFW